MLSRKQKRLFKMMTSNLQHEQLVWLPKLISGCCMISMSASCTRTISPVALSSRQKVYVASALHGITEQKQALQQSHAPPATAAMLASALHCCVQHWQQLKIALMIQLHRNCILHIVYHTMGDEGYCTRVCQYNTCRTRLVHILMHDIKLHLASHLLLGKVTSSCC